MRGNRACRRREGQALLTVMGIIFALCIVLGVVIAASSARTYMAQKLADRTRAVAIAEAGAASAYSVLVTNFSLRTNSAAFPGAAYGGGSYALKVTPVSSNVAVVSSTGTCGIAKEYVVLDVKNYGPYGATNWSSGGTTNGLSTNAFDYAICAGGTLSWAGNADMQMSNGWMHCNAGYSANGNNTIRGNVSSSVSIGMVGGAEITGTGEAPVISGGGIGNPVIATVPLVPIPIIDLTPYYNAALANGQVFTGTKSLSGTVTPSGGIMWVNGDISIGDGLYTGCFIATGDISIGGGNASAEFVKVNQYPVMASRDGDISVQGGKQSLLAFNGLIYCKTGGFNKQGNGNVQGRGSIIAAGGVSKNGGWSGMLYENSTPVPPAGYGGSNPGNYVVGVSAWQR
jgi:hypothetical protein